MALLNNVLPWTQSLAPYVGVVTPVTLVLLAWRARGFLDKLVNNHIHTYKQEILDSQDDAKKEIVQAVRDGNDKIVAALFTLK